MERKPEGLPLREILEILENIWLYLLCHGKS